MPANTAADGPLCLGALHCTATALPSLRGGASTVCAAGGLTRRPSICPGHLPCPISFPYTASASLSPLLAAALLITLLITQPAEGRAAQAAMRRCDATLLLPAVLLLATVVAAGQLVAELRTGQVELTRCGEDGGCRLEDGGCQ